MRHRRARSARVGGAQGARSPPCTKRLDAAAGALREAFGTDAACCVVSDHGQGGASRRVLHPNRRLAECGSWRAGAARSTRSRDTRATRRCACSRRARRKRSSAARAARRRGSRALARFGGIDWRRTAAFSEEVNTQPGVWINAAGREASGAVVAADLERMRREVIDAAARLALEGGVSVVAWARRARTSTQAVRRAARRRRLRAGARGGYAHSLVATPWQRRDVGAVSDARAHELGGGAGAA
jgi:predicted AlkP superfamily phosphohydrolase/phosphomutase